MSLLTRVRRTVAEHRLADAGTRVVVALSGGSDSVALASLVAELAAAGELQFAGVAHLNHQLRDTAGRDEEFCRALSSSLGVPFVAGREDVAARAKRRRRSIEAAGHDARYGFLDRARRELDADVVALGHTRDDQAETFLLRLLRGAGPRGLAAMHPRHGVFIRPLLDCRRAELAAWLEARGRPFITDETNRDTAIPRNRVRAELMPILQSSYNPKIVDALADAAALARDEWEWLQHTADEAIGSLASVTPAGIEFDLARLAGTPLALRRAAIWRAMSRLTEQPVGFAHVGDVLALVDGDHAGAELHLPGQIVKRSATCLVLTSRHGSDIARPGANLFSYSLSIPGEVLVREASGVLTAEEASEAGRDPRTADAQEAFLRRDLCGSRLTVRNRRPGDRLQPLGLGGRKKLQDIFVDRKIARGERDRIPLVLDEAGRILWVAGVGIDEAFRVTDASKPMLILRFKVLGGPV